MTDDDSNDLGYIQKKLPQLRGIGMQTPTFDTDPWKSWFLSPELLRFRQGDDMKEVVLETWVRQQDAEGESMIVFKAEQTRDEWQKDEQGMRITNVRKSIAKEEGRVWDLVQDNWLFY